MVDISRSERNSNFGKAGTIGATLILIAALSVFSVFAKKPERPGRSDQAVPVTVGTAIQKTVPVQLRAIGNVEAYSTVSVKARVGGN